MDELKCFYATDGEVSEIPFIPGFAYPKADVDKVIAELEAWKESQRWRDVLDELPPDGTEVLATDGDGIWLCYKTTMCDGSPWFQPNGQPHIDGVTHWMPLPKAPEDV